MLQAKLETKALKAKRPGFTDERYNETSYYMENGKNILYIYKKITYTIVVKLKVLIRTRIKYLQFFFVFASRL